MTCEKKAATGWDKQNAPSLSSSINYDRLNTKCGHFAAWRPSANRAYSLAMSCHYHRDNLWHFKALKFSVERGNSNDCSAPIPMPAGGASDTSTVSRRRCLRCGTSNSRHSHRFSRSCRGRPSSHRPWSEFRTARETVQLQCSTFLGTFIGFGKEQSVVQLNFLFHVLPPSSRVSRRPYV